MSGSSVTYIMVYIVYTKLNNNKIKFDIRIFLYFKIIDLNEI